MSSTATIDTAIPETNTRPREEAKTQPRRLPPFHVVLLDDNDHTYDYVIHMMQSVFGYPIERGFQLAREVDTRGRVICLTTTFEHAELKREQMLAFGADPLLKRSSRAMRVILEPAE